MSATGPVTVGQQDHELLASPTGQDIQCPQVGVELPDELLKDLISDQVTKTVVDGFEMINVEEDK